MLVSGRRCGAALSSLRAVMSGGAFATKAGGPDLPNFPFSRPSGTEPPAEYARLRKECPVAQAPLFDGSPIWLITKHRDCVSVLSDPRFSKIRTHPGFPELAPGAKAAIEGREPTFVDMDPPNHMRFRSIFEPWLVWPHVETLRPRIAEIVDELLDDMERGPKPANLPEAFSLPVAFKTIYEMLGIPYKDYEFLSSNVAVRASGSSTARDAAAAQEELQSYMENLVEQKLKSPTDDILSKVAETQLKTGRITRDQLVSHAFLLLVAGNATVASMINLGVVTLLDHPDQLDALRSDLSLLPRAVAELCRYHTASSYALRRVALEDVKVGDQTVKAGEGIIALNQSANRDEEVFPNPNRFDIFRSPNAQLAYGSGTHLCVAMPLANVELECALGGLVRRLPNLKLAVPTSELQYSEPSQDVGLKELPVTW